MLCDAAAIFSTVNANRAYLREWLPWLGNISSIHDYDVFIKQSQTDEANSVSLTLGLWDGDNCIGVCGFNSFAPVAKIGYWLAESYQGKGIIQGACQQLIKHGLYQLNLNQIILQAAVDNHKSRAVAEKLGLLYKISYRSMNGYTIIMLIMPFMFILATPTEI